MDLEEIRQVFPELVRLGTVMDRNEQKLMVRVLYRDTGVPSGWLHVLKRGMVLHPREDSLVMKPWMPEMDAVVLCLYLPISGGDGFVLGEIGSSDDLRQFM